MLPKIKGRAAWVFKETNYDIDNIVGVANITLTDIEQMKKVCMTDYDPDFAAAVQDGDVLVGGENFGYGHPHYVAFKALRALGIRTVFLQRRGFQWRGTRRGPRYSEGCEALGYH